MLFRSDAIVKKEDALAPRLKSTEDGLSALSRSQFTIAAQQKDLNSSVQKLKGDEGNIQSAEQRIFADQQDLDPKFQTLRNQANDLSEQAKTVAQQMVQANQIVQRQNELDAKVQGLQSEIVRFQSSKDLDPTRQQKA